MDAREWSPHREVFWEICHHCGNLNIDQLTFHLNHMLDRFVPSIRDSKAFALHALVTPWDHIWLIFNFSCLRNLSQLLHRLKMEGVYNDPGGTKLAQKDWVLGHSLTPLRLSMGTTRSATPIVWRTSLLSYLMVAEFHRLKPKS